MNKLYVILGMVNRAYDQLETYMWILPITIILRWAR